MDAISIHQKALFEAISAKFNNKQAEIAYLQQFFCLNRTAIYGRKSGKTPISFDQGAQLILDLEVAPTPLFNFFAHALQTTPTFPSSVEAAPREYLEHLQQDFRALTLAPNAHIWHETTDLPIIWQKTSRIMAAFKLYYWFKVIAWAKQETCPPFDQNWMERADVKCMLDVGRAILNDYLQIPSTEIWHLHLFDATLAQIESVENTGGFESTAVRSELREALQSVLDKMRKITQNGQKNGHGKPVPIAVFENRINQSGGLLLGQSDTHGFCYLDIGYPDFMRYQDARIVTHQMNRLQNSRSQMVSLSGNEKACFHFFNRLEARIDGKWADIEKIAQPA